MTLRGYKGAAAPTTLALGITSGATSAVANDITTWSGITAAGPFSATINRTFPNEEQILVGAIDTASGALSSVTRGYAESAPAEHEAGETIEVTSTDIDFKEANRHINDTSLNEHTQYVFKAYQPLNVKDVAVGAVGGGVTNDSAAFAAAIAAASAVRGGIVYIPADDYLLNPAGSGGYALSHTTGFPIKIQGEGRFLTKLVTQNSSKNGVGLLVDGDELCDLTIDHQTNNVHNSALVVDANYTALRRIRVLAGEYPFPIYYPGSDTWGDFQYGNVVDDLILEEALVGDGFSFCFQAKAQIRNVRHYGSRLQIYGCKGVQIDNYIHTVNDAVGLGEADGLQITPRSEDIQITNFWTDGTPLIQPQSFSIRGSHSEVALVSGLTYTEIHQDRGKHWLAGDQLRIGAISDPNVQVVTVSADTVDGSHVIPVDSFVANDNYPVGALITCTADNTYDLSIANMTVDRWQTGVIGGFNIGDCDNVAITNLQMLGHAPVYFDCDGLGSHNVRVVNSRIPQVWFAESSELTVDVDLVDCVFPDFTAEAGQSDNTIHNAQVTGVTCRILNGKWENAAPLFTNGSKSTYRVSGLRGFNPQGPNVPQPLVPGSGGAGVTNNTTGVDCTVIVTGGTVSSVSIGGTVTGMTSGPFRVPVGQVIQLTYTVAPTWLWLGD